MIRKCKVCGRNCDSSFHCDSCNDFFEYKRNHSESYKPHMNDIRFATSKSYVINLIQQADNGVVYGYHEKKRDNSRSVVWILLYNFLPVDETTHIQISHTIAHEFAWHKSLFDIGEIEACQKGDCEMIKKIERWLKEI